MKSRRTVRRIVIAAAIVIALLGVGLGGYLVGQSSKAAEAAASKFSVQTFYVTSASMVPTLLPGDQVLALKAGYSLQRGAVVVFKHPPGELPGMCSGAGNDDLVNRIIGLPGETISSRGNTVYINGRPLAEPWLPKGQPLGQPITTQKIPTGEYFIMGDNRTDSCDSRRWGPIPGNLIIGRVLYVLWHDGHPEFKAV